MGSGKSEAVLADGQLTRRGPRETKPRGRKKVEVHTETPQKAHGNPSEASVSHLVT